MSGGSFLGRRYPVERVFDDPDGFNNHCQADNDDDDEGTLPPSDLVDAIAEAQTPFVAASAQKRQTLLPRPSPAFATVAVRADAPISPVKRAQLNHSALVHYSGRYKEPSLGALPLSFTKKPASSSSSMSNKKKKTKHYVGKYSGSHMYNKKKKSTNKKRGWKPPSSFATGGWSYEDSKCLSAGNRSGGSDRL